MLLKRVITAIVLDDGRLRVPQGPGIGVDPIPAAYPDFVPGVLANLGVASNAADTNRSQMAINTAYMLPQLVNQACSCSISGACAALICSANVVTRGSIPSLERSMSLIWTA